MIHSVCLILPRTRCPRTHSSPQRWRAAGRGRGGWPAGRGSRSAPRPVRGRGSCSAGENSGPARARSFKGLKEIYLVANKIFENFEDICQKIFIQSKHHFVYKPLDKFWKSGILPFNERKEAACKRTIQFLEVQLTLSSHNRPLRWSVVDSMVGRLVCMSVIISQKGRNLHFSTPIEALVNCYLEGTG